MENALCGIDLGFHCILHVLGNEFSLIVQCKSFLRREFGVFPGTGSKIARKTFLHLFINGESCAF
jgi:hypothetical protein